MEGNVYYQYSWDIVFQIPNRNLKFKPFSIVSFTKTCNYFSNTIPLYEMSVKIPEKALIVFRNFDRELTVKIKCTKMSGPERLKMTEETVILDDVFIPFYDKNSLPKIMVGSKNVESPFLSLEQKYMPDIPGAMANHQINFVLLRKKDLEMKKFIHNYVLGNTETPVNVGSAVAFIIDQNPYVEEYLMDPPDNNIEFDDLIIRPNELKLAIKQIQVEYGIYAKDLLEFYDNGMLYILNKYENEHVVKDNESGIINVKITERSDLINPTESVFIKNDTKFIYYNRPGKIQITDMETLLGENVGDKFIFSNFGSIMNSGFAADGETQFINPLNEIERPVSSHTDTGVKKIIDYDLLNNPYNMSSYMYGTAIGVPVSFTLTNVDTTHFEPHKRIKLKIDNPETDKLHSGLYNIKEAVFNYTSFGKPGYEHMTFGHVSLNLVNKDQGQDEDYRAEEGGSESMPLHN